METRSPELNWKEGGGGVWAMKVRLGLAAETAPCELVCLSMAFFKWYHFVSASIWLPWYINRILRVSLRRLRRIHALGALRSCIYFPQPYFSNLVMEHRSTPSRI